jgi:hypothetical protein
MLPQVEDDRPMVGSQRTYAVLFSQDPGRIPGPVRRINEETVFVKVETYVVSAGDFRIVKGRFCHGTSSILGGWFVFSAVDNKQVQFS